MFGKYTLLYLISMLKELLNDIVAKDVGHELQGIGLNLTKDLFLLVAIGSLKLLLDKS
jgi:hypothetical protein